VTGLSPRRAHSVFPTLVAVRAGTAAFPSKGTAMTQAELNREVAKAMGESVKAISQIGFVPLTRHPVEVEREPLVIDWDELPERRYSLLP
jgi:hypothetical protein